MTFQDWTRVISEAATLRVRMVEFIGGEPTLHPDLGRLIDHALRCGLAVAVFSNLVHVTDALWVSLSRPGVSLATSYYSDAADEHAAITGRRTHARTRANIAEALRRAIPLRVTVIDIHGGQRITQARAELAALGVRDIQVDRMRQVGRAARGREPEVSQLCGQCANDVAAVSSNGDVWPCVMARWMPLGNVRHTSLSSVLRGAPMIEAEAGLVAEFEKLGRTAHAQSCGANTCSP
jgi:MoaA/NifB/PqqE/SkfB family radical SAM enzyme